MYTEKLNKTVNRSTHLTQHLHIFMYNIVVWLTPSTTDESLNVALDWLTPCLGTLPKNIPKNYEPVMRAAKWQKGMQIIITYYKTHRQAHNVNTSF